MAPRANKALLVIMLVFHKQIFTLWPNRFLTHAAFVCDIFCEAFLAERLMLVDNVLLASQRDVAVMASKMLNMPGFV